MAEHTVERDAECICPYTPPETWLSAASCGYGSGYEPGSMQEWNPDCPAHPPTPMCDADEGRTGARCFKEPDHAGPHNGWAHYPGQLVSWDASVLPPAKSAS